MATSRQERMQERMRGAGRHQVEDISFGFVLPVEEEEPIPEPEVPAPPPTAPPKDPTPTPPTAEPRRSTPNTSAKRKHLAGEDATQAANLTAPSPIPTERPLDTVVPESPEEDSNVPDQNATLAPSAALNSSRSTGRRSSEPRRVTYASEVEVRETDESGRLSSKRTSVPLSSPAATPRAAAFAEEVGESPADAPGSGRRRPLQTSEASPVVGSSTLLQRVLEELDETVDEPPSSSPVERMKANRRAGSSVRSVASRTSSRPTEARRRSPRLSVGSSAGSENTDGPSSLVILGNDDHDGEGQEDSNLEVEEAPVPEEEMAEEITETEAARRLGRKRPRRSMPAASPELGSGLLDQAQEDVEPEEEPEVEKEAETPEPAAKRRRTKKAAASPAIQQQPKTRGPKPKATTQAKEKPPPKKQATRKKRKSKDQEQDGEEEGETATIPFTVQRFTKQPKGAAQLGSDDDDEEDDDIFTASIPFANRGGVNAIDVLSHLCDGVLERLMERIHERAQDTDDAAVKREQKTMAKALEAFQEQLRTRLLEHTIALDTLHALRKRVRAAQREKIALRDEIVRIRAEREQVGTRMDAIRLKHEADSKDALRRISMSSMMHDIELVVAQGRAAPPLSAAEEKKAELMGLEMLIGTVADQVCPSSGTGGGSLKQIRDFNAFLERAAGALEGRSSS